MAVHGGAAVGVAADDSPHGWCLVSRLTPKRVRAMVEAATPGPWTSERAIYSTDHLVTMDRRSEAYVTREPDAALIAAAPDLAADLLDAHAALATERERRERADERAVAAEAECARLREAMRRQAAAVRMHQSARERMDAHDQATLRSLAGEDRAYLIEETAAARRERDDWNARATALETERDTARAEADALRAQVDSDAALISALADAGGALAEALDATVLDGRHPVETARMATKLRAVMADVWATMEGR